MKSSLLRLILVRSVLVLSHQVFAEKAKAAVKIEPKQVADMLHSVISADRIYSPSPLSYDFIF